MVRLSEGSDFDSERRHNSEAASVLPLTAKVLPEIIQPEDGY
jgi:hypothetical protein